MGKIRVSTLGSTEEELLKEKQKVKREEKKKRVQSQKVHIAGMKGGQRVKSVGAESEEELNKLAKLTEEVDKDQAEGIKAEEVKKAKKARKARIRSKRYKEALMKIDHGKLYPFCEAITKLREISLTKFDPTVELHINVVEKGLRGTISLPHGTGKETRVVIADSSTIDKIVADAQSGKIEFDALIAHPSVMPKLARVAKFLGPKGLMPNPKAGTISAEPEKAVAKIKGGEVTWKTEADFPIIHQIIGKLTFKDSQLEENFSSLVKSIDATKIKSITLKSTMSPGIKVQTG